MVLVFKVDFYNLITLQQWQFYVYCTESLRKTVIFLYTNYIEKDKISWTYSNLFLGFLFRSIHEYVIWETININRVLSICILYGEMKIYRYQFLLKINLQCEVFNLILNYNIKIKKKLWHPDFNVKCSSLASIKKGLTVEQKYHRNFDFRFR